MTSNMWLKVRSNFGRKSEKDMDGFFTYTLDILRAASLIDMLEGDLKMTWDHPTHPEIQRTQKWIP